MRVRTQTMRRRVNRVMGLMLAYQGVFTGVSILGGLVAGAVMLGQSTFSDSGVSLDPDKLSQMMDDPASAWLGVIMLMCALAGFLFVSLMRRHDVYTREFWLGGPHDDREGLPMTYGGARMRASWLLLFVGLLASLQMMLSLGQFGWSVILGGDGLASPALSEFDDTAIGVAGAVAPAADQAGPLGLNIVLTVYVWLVAPVVEEVGFRGVLMHELKPLGRNFAIFTSAMVFGLFHDDLVQGLFAFGAGLLFGYVAMEFSLKWSIMLHCVNNALISGLFVGIAGQFGDVGPEVYGFALIVLGLIALLVLVIRYRRDIGGYLRANRAPSGAVAAVWGAPCLIVFVAINALFIAVSFAGAMAA